MCSHCWRKVNDVWICTKCGLTRLIDGRFYFDHQYRDIAGKKRRRRRENKHERLTDEIS